jgi:cell division protein FtsL
MKQEIIEESSHKLAIKKTIVYGVLVAAVLISAFMVVLQVFAYRHDFRDLNSYMREREDINAEWGRLLIEQQTFGATAQIGTRAECIHRQLRKQLSFHYQLNQSRRSKASVWQISKLNQPGSRVKSSLQLPRKVLYR